MNRFNRVITQVEQRDKKFIIVDVVREVLEEKNTAYLGWEVREPMLVTASEGYDLTTDTYVEALQFTFKVI